MQGQGPFHSKELSVQLPDPVLEIASLGLELVCDGEITGIISCACGD